MTRISWPRKTHSRGAGPGAEQRAGAVQRSASAPRAAGHPPERGGSWQPLPLMLEKRRAHPGGRGGGARLRRRCKRAAEAGPPRLLVTSARDLPAGTVLTTSDLQATDIGANRNVLGSLTPKQDEAAVVGRQLAETRRRERAAHELRARRVEGRAGGVHARGAGGARTRWRPRPRRPGDGARDVHDRGWRRNDAPFGRARPAACSRSDRCRAWATPRRQRVPVTVALPGSGCCGASASRSRTRSRRSTWLREPPGANSATPIPDGGRARSRRMSREGCRALLGPVTGRGGGDQGDALHGSGCSDRRLRAEQDANELLALAASHNADAVLLSAGLQGLDATVAARLRAQGRPHRRPRARRSTHSLDSASLDLDVIIEAPLAEQQLVESLLDNHAEASTWHSAASDATRRAPAVKGARGERARGRRQQGRAGVERARRLVRGAGCPRVAAASSASSTATAASSPSGSVLTRVEGSLLGLASRAQGEASPTRERCFRTGSSTPAAAGRPSCSGHPTPPPTLADAAGPGMVGERILTVLTTSFPPPRGVRRGPEAACRSSGDPGRGNASAPRRAHHSRCRRAR